MHYILRLLIILPLLESCKGQDPFIESRLKIADNFVECLRQNSSDKILNYTIPEIDHKISDKESRDFYVNKAFDLIEKFGLPPKEKWIIKYDKDQPFDRLLITIPVFKGLDSISNLLQAEIIIAFPPGQISDKIYRYEVNTNYVPKPILAPH